MSRLEELSQSALTREDIQYMLDFGDNNEKPYHAYAVKLRNLMLAVLGDKKAPVRLHVHVHVYVVTLT